MRPIIANFATIGKTENCEFRGYRNLAISATLRGMEAIDGKWILARLTGWHGEKKQLADFIGIDTDRLAKVLSGARKVQAEEIPKIMAYFAATGAVAVALSPEDRQLLELIHQLSPYLIVVGGSGLPADTTARLSGNQFGSGGGDGLEVRLAKLEVRMDHATGLLTAIDGRLRSVEIDMATVKESIRHLPSKGFIVGVVLSAFAVLGGLTIFPDQVRGLLAWVYMHTGNH